MLTLYHATQSRSTRFLWLLEELGADYKIVYSSITRQDGSSGPDDGNPHPDKKVPALVHDGALITESSAIALYLTDLFPKAGIGPQVGDPLRGEYLSWLAYYSGVIEPVVNFQFAGLGDNAVLRRTFRGTTEMHQRLVTALEKSPYLLGEKFSAVDILLASLGAFARQTLPAGEPVDSYLNRCADRPARTAGLAKDAPPK
ncbi:MAG: glutathione S-transferase family protein [Pseudomonadota bacterium]